MALKGELLSADLSNVFQMLAMNGKRGLLTVQDRVNPVARRRFFLDGQTVLLAEKIADVPSLALLVEMGRITYEQYAGARQRGSRFHSDPLGILEAQGIVGRDDVEAYRTRASNEALLEVFLWRDIRFNLDETVTVAPVRDAPPLQLDHVIMEAARRQDEWRHVVLAVGSHREVFRKRQEEVDTSALAPIERIVLDHVDGIDATEELMAKCGLPRYFVDLGLANLLKAGVVAKLGPEELILTGDRLVEAGQLREGIRLFHGALRHGRASVAVHKRLARAHVKQNEIARACGHLRFCSVLAVKDGERKEALALLHEAWKLLPTHFSTLERILSILLENPLLLTKEDRACLADGRRLLQVWHDTNEAERAVDLATRIWAIDQSDREVLHTAARLNVRLGRVDAAIQAYLVLGERLRADHDLRGALDIYRTIATLDGAQSRGCEARIEELRRAIDRLVKRKKRGKTFRAGMLAALVLGCLWGGYAWYGDQRVSELDQRVAVEAGARDALLKDCKAAGFWFRLAPAGARAAAKAAVLEFAIQAERDAQHEENERTAARLAAEFRAADDAVSEGLRMVKAGDLAHAADRLREGLASFPTSSSPGASRARKALSDVETYLAAGRRLIEDARSLEASDPDAAFRLRLKALRDYELVPEVRDQKLQLRIESVPAEAKLVVQGDAEEYTAPIGISVGGQGLVAVEGRAAGFVPRTVSLALPPEVATWTIILERVARVSFKVGEPLACAVPSGADRVLVTARTGPVFLVDTTSGSVAAVHRPGGLHSQSRRPVISGSRALVLLDDGRARILSLPGLAEVATVRLTAQPGISPVPFADGWIVATAPNRVEILDERGTVRRPVVLPDGVVIRGLDVSNGVIACATGEVGLLAIDARDGAVRAASPKLTNAVAAGPAGSWLVHRPQAGIVRIDPATGQETMVLQHAGDSAAIRRIREDLWAVLFDGELVFLGTQGPAGRARIHGARADGTIVVDASTGRAGVIVDGWCSMYEPATGHCVAGYACEAGLVPAFAGGAFVNVHADGRVTITGE